MNILEHQIKIKLSDKLSVLLDIANNVWWSWNTDALALFESINPAVWESSNHNPITVLSTLSKADCARLESDSLFISRLNHVKEAFNEFMAMPRWYHSHPKKVDNFLVAYFSLEYGLHESLPLYSGGLGILSGDHCKSASDVGIPFIAVGLLYRNGYFQQYTNSDGWQQEAYGYNQFSNMPIRPAKDANGEEIYIKVPIRGKDITVKVWKLNVGLIKIILLDTDLSSNIPYEREITGRLYSGDSDMRIRQEVILGIGGVRALEACGYSPTVFHLNEGHPAFVGFERFNKMIRSGIQYNKAMEIVRKSTLFTTHTPVPAGFDVFTADQIRSYIEPVFNGTNFHFNQIMAIGRSNAFDENEPFSMAIAAIRMSTYRNGVSKLHGEVSRKIFQYMWPQALLTQVPIGHITNGVHLPSFISSDFKRVLYQYLSDTWHKSPHDFNIWSKVSEIPSSAIHETKKRLREKLIVFVRKRIRKSLLEKSASAHELMECEGVLSTKALTIGFARRFATYKRALLLFTDEDRLRRILLNPERPVQIIIAGKAHPKDNEGKEFIKRIIQIARKPEFRKHIVFIENYDIEVARFMTSGVDIWLNTPRRPMEASGTSGMKAAVNGALNFSVLDGWWVEGFNGENGWSIGAGEDYRDYAYQDYVESHDLYNKLENEIIPLFYAKDHSGLPEGWLKMIKSTMSTIPSFFNTSRMLMEYTEKYYLPLHSLQEAFLKEGKAEDYFVWWDNIVAHWDELSIFNCSLEAKDYVMGERVEGYAHIKPGNLELDDIAVYTVLEYNGESLKLNDPTFIPMGIEEVLSDGTVKYKSVFTIAKGGKIKVGFAAVPSHEFITHIFETNKVKWA